MKPAHVALAVLGALGVGLIASKAMATPKKEESKASPPAPPPAPPPGATVKVGDVVKVPTSALSVVTAGGSTSFPSQVEGTATIAVTALEPGAVFGIVKEVSSPLGSVSLPQSILAVTVKADRNKIL